MINSQDVLNAMHDWWTTAGAQISNLGADRVERTPAAAIFRGLVFLQRENHNEYAKLKTEAAKIGHFRQLLTTWKSVVTKMEKHSAQFPENFPFYDPKIDALRAFALYYEQIFPELYYVLWTKNVFLGIKFTEEDKQRVKILEQELMKNALAKERAQNERMFYNMFFGAAMSRMFR